MRVLVTGATGFVGSYVLRRVAADRGHEVTFLARASSDDWRVRDLAGVTRIDADLGDADEVRARLSGLRLDVVVHLAWNGVGGADRNDPRQIDNLHHTLSLLGAARAAGAQHFVGVGSQAEYGPSSGALDEDAPTKPTTLYGASKLCTSLFAQHACTDLGMRFAWVRVFSTYGPMDHPRWMIPSIILELLGGKRPALTLGEQRWDYLHAADAADAIARVALHPAASGVFNLGSGEASTIRSIVERIRDSIDPSLPLGFGEVPYRPDQVMHLQARIDRLRAIGWAPAVPLDRGLMETVDWYRAHPTGHS